VEDLSAAVALGGLRPPGGIGLEALPGRTTALARPGSVRLALGVGWLLLVAFSAHAIFGFDSGLDDLFQKWVNDAIAVIATLVCAERGRRVRGERAAWLLVAFGIGLWTAGNVYYTLFIIDLDPLPVPSVADALWLSMYPPIAIALVLLLRGRTRRFPKSLLLDGVIGAFSIASVSAAVVLEAVIGAGLQGGLGETATNLAYPMADLVLLGVMTGVIALSGWRVGRDWGFVTAALVAFAVTDGFFLFQTSIGTYDVGTIIDAGWLLAVLLFAEAAWQPIPEARAVAAHGRRMLVLPAVFSAAALLVLLVGDLRRMNDVALALAATTIAAVVVRMAISFLDVSKATDALDRAREDAERRSRIDALTGLFNRRHLGEVFQHEFARALRDGTTPGVLVIDLDLFKQVNDRYGHAAGDAVLIETARRLERTVRSFDCVGRWGGEEYCAVLTAIESDADLVRRAEDVRLVVGRERFVLPGGETIDVTCSIGAARASDTITGESLLQLADQALYSAKRGGRDRTCMPGDDAAAGWGTGLISKAG
jgi:diguanylate cyclase (GGDEF)-like protein